MDAKIQPWPVVNQTRHTILVIEDNTHFRAFLSQLLIAAGFDVLQSPDGNDGLRRFHSDNPDLIITNVVMAGTDGLDVIKGVKQAAPDKPVIAMSNLKDQPHKQNFLSLALMHGANAVLAKPFNIDELHQTLDRLLDIHSEQGQSTASSAEPIL